MVDGSSGHHYYTAYFDVDIYRIILASTPITGPTSIQKCCTEEVEYCEPDLADQNAWNWTISGGGSASSSNGLHCIDVTPNNTGNITVSVVASRTTNSNGYSRSASKTVTRFDPVLSSIHGFSYVCKGSTLALSVDDVCGSTAIMWTSSSSDLYVYTGQGTTTATYRPSNLAANGTVVTATATAYFPGGCTANQSNLAITIYDSGTPPTPAGNVTLVPVLPEEYDPCNDDEVGWYAVYDGTYANGIIAVNPSFLLASPHNHHHGSVSVEVCYRNLCGSGNTCRTYTVYLPEDCVEDPIVNTPPLDTSASKLVSSIDKLAQPITPRTTSELSNAIIYPNPASNSISILTNFKTGFSVEIFNLNGKLVKTATNDSNFLNLDIIDLNPGVYITRLFDPKMSINKKLSIVK